MDIDLTQIEFRLFANMLHDYIREKDEQIDHLEHDFRAAVERQNPDYHGKLIEHEKKISSEVDICLKESKDLFYDSKMGFVHDFFRRCVEAEVMVSKHLSHALQVRINKSIETAAGKVASKPKHKKEISAE
jgi:hypothetical protein